jgi:hypothetical protein
VLKNGCAKLIVGKNRALIAPIVVCVERVSTVLDLFLSLASSGRFLLSWGWKRFSHCEGVTVIVLKFGLDLISIKLSFRQKKSIFINQTTFLRRVTYP